MAADRVTEDFLVDLRLRSAEPVRIVQFVVDPAGFEVSPERAVVDFLTSAFAGHPKPDLVVTVAGPAAAFARKYRDQLFPGVPLLFGAADRRYLEGAPLAADETAVPVDNDFARIIDDILQVLPQTRQVFMLMGSVPTVRFWRRELEGGLERFRGRLTFSWSGDLSLPEILRRVADLPSDAVIFHQGFPLDADGRTYADARLFAELARTASVPLFATQSVYLGHGIVGGTLMPVEDLGRRMAEAAVQILHGESPGAIRLPAQLPGPPVFDWRELQRWRIDERRLPPSSVVKFRGPTLWTGYRREVLLGLLGLLLQSVLIVGLLYQRQARRRAEVESRLNLSMAADANRRVTMSALTGSIAHEISQPLNAILQNAQAGEMLVTSNRATPQALQGILSDIRAADLRATQIIERHRSMLRTRQVDRKPLDMRLVVGESLAFVSHETRARQIQVDVGLPADPCIIVGDQVLLQQVLVNLIMNAIEAMAATPANRRSLTVQCRGVDGNAVVSVRDAGTGLPEHVSGQLFEPFVTTKTSGIGIGLTIARSIVDAHRGSFEGHNNADGGATFTFTVPARTPHEDARAAGQS
jgi:signal transduction histidine kinase